MNLVEQIETACLLEATARKPGNVHPAAAFCDLSYDDFVQAAHVTAVPLAAAQEVGVGQAVLDAVKATRVATGTNVNLGIALLIAPLAAVPIDTPLKDGINSILTQTTVSDAALVYTAIRIAQPGGLGKAESQDVSESPTIGLRDAMVLAAERDRIAEQYASDFKLVFAARQQLCRLWTHPDQWELAIISLHIWMMSQWPDTLIVRKCGHDVANEASRRAGELLATCDVETSFEPEQMVEFDKWLRADGHRRNPGTTADLIAATLFAAFRDGFIEAPSRDSIQRHAKTHRCEIENVARSNHA